MGRDGGTRTDIETRPADDSDVQRLVAAAVAEAVAACAREQGITA